MTKQIRRLSGHQDTTLIKIGSRLSWKQSIEVSVLVSYVGCEIRRGPVSLPVDLSLRGGTPTTWDPGVSFDLRTTEEGERGLFDSLHLLSRDGSYHYYLQCSLGVFRPRSWVYFEVVYKGVTTEKCRTPE